MYRGALGREKTVQAGVFAALVMATRPEARRSLVATARQHGVEVYGETVPNGYQDALGVPAPVGRTDDDDTIMLPPQADPLHDDLSSSAAAVLPPRPDLWTPAEPRPEGEG